MPDLAFGDFKTTKFCSCLGKNYDVNPLYCPNCGKFHRQNAKIYNLMMKNAENWRKMKKEAENRSKTSKKR